MRPLHHLLSLPTCEMGVLIQKVDLHPGTDTPKHVGLWDATGLDKVSPRRPTVPRAWGQGGIVHCYSCFLVPLPIPREPNSLEGMQQAQ